MEKYFLIVCLFFTCDCFLRRIRFFFYVLVWNFVNATRACKHKDKRAKHVKQIHFLCSPMLMLLAYMCFIWSRKNNWKWTEHERVIKTELSRVYQSKVLHCFTFNLPILEGSEKHFVESHAWFKKITSKESI